MPYAALHRFVLPTLLCTVFCCFLPSYAGLCLCAAFCCLM